MRIGAACVIALASVSCGGGAAPAKSVPASPADTDSPAEPEGHGAPGAQPGYQQQAQPPGQPGEALGPTGQFAEEPPMTLEEALETLDRAATELSSAGRDCDQACKALGSMERSRDRICELNGPDDPGKRCEKAKDRVESAREILKSRCGSCEP